MNTLVEYILAAMMTITSPGMSTFSQTPVAHCDAECAVTPLCENEHDFRCKPPQFNKSLYVQRQKELVEHGVRPKDAIEQAVPLGYSRPETYEEGLARYYVVATQIVKAAQDNSYGYCLEENKCKELTTDHTDQGSYQACYKQCYDERIWKKKTEELVWALFTVSTFESGWRADVQAGTGWAGRGDCEWAAQVELEDGSIARRKVQAWTVGAAPVISTCRSFGLTQVMFGNPPRKMSAWNVTYTYDQVMGLDAGATYASLNLASRYLSMGARGCRGVEHDWAWAMFSMYGSGNGCKVTSAKLRSSRFWKWAYKPNQRKLEARHVDALATPRVQELIAYLTSATSPVLWLPAVTVEPLEAADALVAQR